MSPLQIPVQLAPKSKLSEIDYSNLGFGHYMSDHMFMARYSEGKWHSPHILPYGPLELMPTALALHYGQSVFEGMKAFKMNDGNISVFRMDKHYERLCQSLNRMCMPLVPEDYFHDGIIQLLSQDYSFIPKQGEDSLYIRPLLFASEGKLGVKVAEEYIFVIMAGPVGPFYSSGLKVKVEENYIRSAHGGTGAAKCAGNYGGAFYATRQAREEGYDQVLWTDLSPELNIEESGTMNVFFRIGDKLITPALSDTILSGITRDSVLALTASMGLQIEERTISANELAAAAESGQLKEAFGSGTAAITASIAMIGIRGENFELPALNENSICTRLHKELSAIRSGEIADKFNWNTIIKAPAIVKS